MKQMEQIENKYDYKSRIHYHWSFAHTSPTYGFHVKQNRYL